MLKSRRQQLHARIAQVLEQNYPQRAEVEPELVAHHYTIAGLSEPAVTYWVRAAQRASNRSENREVLSHVNNGLKLLEALPENMASGREKAELYYVRGLAYRDLKGFNSSDTRQAFLQAQSLYEQFVDDPTRLVSTLRGVYKHYFTRGDHREGRKLAEQIFIIINRQTQDSDHLSQYYPVIGSNLFHRGKPLEARKFYEDALSLYVDSARQSAQKYVLDPKTSALMNLSLVLWIIGYPQQAINSGNEAIRFSRELSQPSSLVTALVWVISLKTWCGKIADVEMLNKELIATNTKHSFTGWEHRAAFIEGRLSSTKGADTSSGLALIRHALDTSWAEDARLHWTWMAIEAAEICLELGEIDESTRLLTKVSELVDKNDERFWESELHRLRGKVLLSRAEPDQTEAEACFLSALEIARNQGARSLELRAATSLARLWRDQGKCRKARDLLTPIYDWFTEGFDTVDLKDSRALLDELT